MIMIQQKMKSMQEALNALSLQSQKEIEECCLDRVLLGKIITTRTFKRFTITEIVQKTWKTKLKINIEKIEDNIFKFTFGNKEDKDRIYKGRPWSLNGAHLILKEWALDKSLKEISFQYSTFTLQVHGLPPVYMHERSVKKIGELVGKVHLEWINKRSVVAYRFLRLRVDILVEEPIPVGFFQERDERWIQFKYKRLADFCYNCGMLNHVTGSCEKGIPATITTCNDIFAKLYGPWMRSEHTGNLLFVNAPEEETDVDQRSLVVKEGTTTERMIPGNNSYHFGETIEQAVDKIRKAREQSSLEDFQNALQMSTEL